MRMTYSEVARRSATKAEASPASDPFGDFPTLHGGAGAVPVPPPSPPHGLTAYRDVLLGPPPSPPHGLTAYRDVLLGPPQSPCLSSSAPSDISESSSVASGGSDTKKRRRLARRLACEDSQKGDLAVNQDIKAATLELFHSDAPPTELTVYKNTCQETELLLDTTCKWRVLEELRTRWVCSSHSKHLKFTCPANPTLGTVTVPKTPRNRSLHTTRLVAQLKRAESGR